MCITCSPQRNSLSWVVAPSEWNDITSDEWKTITWWFVNLMWENNKKWVTSTAADLMPLFPDIPTRKANILDLCYGNITDVFSAQAHPPLGFSDHNVVFLFPHYKPELKCIKPRTHCSTQWSEAATTQLQGSQACTNWDIFSISHHRLYQILCHHHHSDKNF